MPNPVTSASTSSSLPAAPGTAFPLTFVVGTGRTGSTTLSRALRLHPGILSLNELLASLVEPDRALPEQPMTGEEFWQLLAEPSPVFDGMIRAGVPLPEILDPRPGLPALRLMVLPHLTDEPAALLADLGRQAPTWPTRPAGEHLMALFAWLRTRLGRHAVVERSGYSVVWIPRLREAFPGAGFVHMYRSGPDCALSMSRHIGYRTIVLFRDILAHTGSTSFADLTEEQKRSLPPDLAAFVRSGFDPTVVRETSMAVARFGTLWSELMAEAIGHLAAVPDERRTALSYERLLDDPKGELGRLAEFAGAEPHPEWLAAARPLFRPALRGAAARALTREELTDLRTACEPGERAMAEVTAQ